MAKKLKYFLTSVLCAAVLAAVGLLLPSLAAPVSADTEFYYATVEDDLEIVNSELRGFRDSFSESAHPEGVKLVIPDYVKSVAANAFEGQTCLVSLLEFPAGVTSVGASAFKDCTRLESVKFARNAEGSLTIGTSAFEGCSALAVAELPVQLGEIGGAAFKNAGLSVIYIHGTGTITYNGEEFFPASAMIVYDDYLGYFNGTGSENLSAYRANMTYVVTITFHHGGGVEETVERLAGKSFDLVKRDGGLWSAAAGGFVPVQNGYTDSAWYDTSDFRGNPFFSSDVSGAVAAVNPKLEQATTAEGIFHYYARLISNPAIDTVGLVYDENTSYNADALPNLLAGDFDSDAMAVELIGKKTIDNAGDYNIKITLHHDRFGTWGANNGYTNSEGAIIKTITVQRKAIRLSDELDWRGGRVDERSGRLLDGTIYIYKNGDDTRYSYTRIADADLDGFTFYATKEVDNSVMRNLNDEVNVSIADSEYYTVDYKDLIFSNAAQEEGVNSASEEGMYVAKAVVNAGNNYMFTTEATSFTRYGQTVTLSADATQALVTKEWYLLSVGNGIYVKGTQDSFSMSGWTFKQIVTVYEPELQFYSPDFEFSLTLTRDGDTDTVAEHKPIAQFMDYVNVSMPAGDYRLTLHVPAANDGDTEYIAYNAQYTFRVAPAAFDSSWGADVQAKLVDAEWVYEEDADGNPILQLYSYDGEKHAVDLKIWNDFNSANKINPERRGVWKNAENNKYYSDRFYLTYNLSRMQSKTYYTFEELNGLSERIVPKNVDDYVVYYQLKANNYVSLVDENDDAGRRAYNFNLTLYGVITPPEIAEVTYTGQDIKPVVPSDVRYSAAYNDANGYVKAGTHTITLTSTDPVHYRWAEDATPADSSYTLSFTIARAQNQSKRLDVFSWNYGDYDSDRDAIRLETVFGSGTAYTCRLVAEDNTVYQIENFGSAPVGTYTLEITVVGYDENDATTADYDWYKLELSTSVRVLKSVNRWVTQPTMTTWTAGSYNPEENKVVGETTLGGEYSIVISLTGDEENIFFDSANGIDRLAEAGPGVYRVRVVVAETDNFAELTHVFDLKVFDRPGLPWWATLLIVLGALGIAAAVMYILHRKGVLQILSGRIVFAMRTKATVDATIAAIRANKKAEEAKLSLARARAEDAREARRQQMLEKENMTIDEQAAALDEKVKMTEMKANKLSKRAENIRKRADKLKDKASKTADADAADADAAEPAEDSAPSEENPNGEE